MSSLLENNLIKFTGIIAREHRIRCQVEHDGLDYLSKKVGKHLFHSVKAAVASTLANERLDGILIKLLVVKDNAVLIVRSYDNSMVTAVRRKHVWLL